MGSSRVPIRCDPNLKEAVHELCDAYGIDVSSYTRGLWREGIREGKKSIPQDIYARAQIEQIKEEHKPFQGAAHLPSNFFDETRGFLRKRFPLHPREVEEQYYEPYMESIEEAYAGDDYQDLRDRKKGQLDWVLRGYRRLHVDTRAEDIDHIMDSVADYAVGIKIEEDMETARAFVNDMVRDDVLPEVQKDETMDMVREMSRTEWQEQWKKAARGQGES